MKTVIISSLPRIMIKLRAILLIAGIAEKLLIGPTVPNPGPIPAMQVATELADVRGSAPFMAMKRVPATNTKIYSKINDRIEVLVFSSMSLPLSFSEGKMFG